jgi:hypothetical protein
MTNLNCLNEVTFEAPIEKRDIFNMYYPMSESVLLPTFIKATYLNTSCFTGKI